MVVDAANARRLLSEGYLIAAKRRKGAHEVVSTKADDFACYGYVTQDTFEFLETRVGEGVVISLLILMPGCGPSIYLAAAHNEEAKKWAVKIEYVYRPNEPVTLD